MKIIKNINRLIFNKVIEIIFVTVFVISSYSLWNDLETKTLLATASGYENLSYTSMNIENSIAYSMYPMTNEDAMKNLVPSKIVITNDSLTNEDYTLILKISKNSTLDYNYLNISINEEIYPLSELVFKEDRTNYIFILDENNLKGSKKEYFVNLWLDEKTGNEMQGKSLSMTFNLLRGIAEL